MYSTPGGPQGADPRMALIQRMSRQYAGLPIGLHQDNPFNPGGGHRDGTDYGNDARYSTRPLEVDTRSGGYTVPGHPIFNTGQGDALGNQGRGGTWQTGAPDQSLDPAVATAMGANPQGLHPMIQKALEAIRSQGSIANHMGIPELQGSLGVGAHPQVDRFHAIHASQALAQLMAQATQRGLSRNQGRRW